jgi:hypothetical protein
MGAGLFGCRVGCSRAKFLVLVLTRFRVSVGLERYVVGSVRIEEKKENWGCYGFFIIGMSTRKSLVFILKISS